MTSRLIENILEAEALAEKMRDTWFVAVTSSLPSSFLEELRHPKPGKIIRLPPGVEMEDLGSRTLVKHGDFPYF